MIFVVLPRASDIHASQDPHVRHSNIVCIRHIEQSMGWLWINITLPPADPIPEVMDELADTIGYNLVVINQQLLLR